MDYFKEAKERVAVVAGRLLVGPRPTDWMRDSAQLLERAVADLDGAVSSDEIALLRAVQTRLYCEDRGASDVDRQLAGRALVVVHAAIERVEKEERS